MKLPAGAKLGNYSGSEKPSNGCFDCHVSVIFNEVPALTFMIGFDLIQTLDHLLSFIRRLRMSSDDIRCH